MGKHRFRLSDMMPNAWFYKLKDMNNNPGRKNHHPPLPNKTQTLLPPPPPPPPIVPKRASYYFPSNSPVHPKAVDTTHFPSPDSTPLSSTRRRRPPRRRKLLLPTTTHHLAITSPTRLLLSSSSSSTTTSSSSACRASSDETDVHSYCIRTTTTTTTPTAPPPPPPELDIVLDLHLRPILTKPPPAPPKPKNQPTKIKPTPKSAAGTSAATQPRLRSTTSPNRKVRVAPRRPPAPARRRGVGESFAVVKSSSDPSRDFRESMVEMILENKLTAPKDLEDLLACYLSLNSSEYHDVIVKVFEEIWLEITNFVRN